MDKLWKATERAIARRLGGTRRGPSGLAGADVTTSCFSVEVKERKSFPQWLEEAVKQATTAASEGKLALVVLHKRGQRHDHDLVVVRLKDFQDWLAKLPGEDGAQR